jgi:hypothetical protein
VLDAQSDLITQARRGVALAATAQDQHAQAAHQLAQLRRARLDEAFDADVREQVTLDAEWVIEARAAYAAALDAFAKQNAATSANDAAAHENLQAVDAALERLAWLSSLQRKWTLEQLTKTEAQP